MTTIKQVLLLRMSGMKNRAIGRQLGINKETVNKYVRLADADPLSLEELCSLDNPVLERRFCGGNPAYSDKRFDVLQDRLPYIVNELADKHVTLRILWEEYRADHPDGYGYTQFCYHCNQYLSAQKPSFVMKQDRPGGMYMHIDFAGDTMSYFDMETGEEIKCQIFVAVLPASDYPFIKAVRSQKVEDFIGCIECAFRAFGGVPSIIVPDNLKSAVIKSDRYQPDLNTMLADLGNHYRCAVMPARAYKPKDKSNAEGMVCRSYYSIYAPLRHDTHFSLEELNDAIASKVKLFIQKRMQQIPFTREERFIAIDKPALKPMCEDAFEIRIRTELKVQPNSHVYLGRDKAYYSVPYSLIGKSVKVEYTPTLVHIYHDGKKVALHARCYTQGKYNTVKEHMPSYYEQYTNLSPDKYIDRAMAVSENLANVMMDIFTSRDGVPPEVHYRSCDGLFSLQKKSDGAIFEKACEIAIQLGCCNYRFIKSMVESKCAGYQDDDRNLVLFPSDKHSNIRGAQYYGKTNSQNQPTNNNKL